MTEQELIALRDWFAAYVKTFYSEDADIQQHMLLKEEHTYKVMEHCRALAGALDLDADSCRLAQAVGLLHDVGRFSQYSTYRTFVDHKSVDHAQLGLKVIERLPELAGLPPGQQDELRFAIGNHNIMKLPEAMTDGCRLYATLIRDADKLDIFRVLSPYLTPPSDKRYSAVFVEDLLLGRQSSYKNIRLPEDRKLIRLSWIYDINYIWTLRQIVERRYIETIVAHLPQTPDILAAVTCLEQYVAVCLKEGAIHVRHNTLPAG